MKSTGAVIVTRVSTPGQDEGTSPETQLASCRAKAAQLNIPIVAEYYDAGISGAVLLSRTGMQSALADIKEKRADTLICPNMSRFSRDVEHQQAIKKAVRAAGGRLIFCDMTFEDTPEGDLNFTIQGGFAEYERKVIRKRMMDGKRKRLQEGKQVIRSRSPFGYHIVTKNDVIRGDYPEEAIGTYIAQPDKLKMVTQAFEDYANGRESLLSLCRRFNDADVPTPQNGKYWRKNAIHFILKNPVYKGEPAGLRWETWKDEGRLQRTSKVNGEPLTSTADRRISAPENWILLSAPAAISTEIWDRAQERMAENKKTLGGNPTRARLLAGRVFCGECGSAMYNGGRDRYVCGKHRDVKNQLGRSVCDSMRYPIDDVEESVMQSLRRICADPAQVLSMARAMAENAAHSPEPDPRKRLATVESLLAKLAHEEAATIQAQVAGIQAGASPSAYAAAFSAIAERRNALNKEKNALKSSLAGLRKSRKGALALSVQDIHTQALETVNNVLLSPDLTTAEKRIALGTAVERVSISRGSILIQYRAGLFGSEVPEKISIQSAP